MPLHQVEIVLVELPCRTNPGGSFEAAEGRTIQYNPGDLDLRTD
jgi:hypothetical protein